MVFSRRQLLVALGSTGGIVLAGCLGSGPSNESGDQNTNTPAPNDLATAPSTPTSQTNTPTPPNTGIPAQNAAASTPIPDDPSRYTYATMGTGEKPTITYFGNWKCPVCRTFSTRLLGDYVTEYVESGEMSLKFRALAYGPTTEPPFQPFLGPDAVRATRAGLIVWNIEPESYWPYHEYVFSHQPPENQTWATTDRLIEFAKNAGVKRTEKLRSQLDTDKYKKEIKQTVITAAKVGVTGTPQLLINGQVVSPFKRERVRALLDEVREKKNTETTTKSGTATNTNASMST